MQPMPPDVRAALEELIAGARGNPLLMALAAAQPDADPDQIETTLRRIADGGMTPDEARAFVRALESPKTAAAIGAILTAIPPDKAGDRLLLDWGWAEAERVIEANPPPEPPPPPAVTDPGSWPWAFLPLTCGWYADRDNLLPTLDAIADLARKHGCVGRLGIDIEGTGHLGNPGASIEDLFAEIAASFDFIAGVVAPACVVRGLVMKCTAGNTNDFGKGFKSAWRDTSENRARYIAMHRKLAADLAPFAPWVIAQAVAETDGSMAVAFRKVTQQAWRDAGFPSDHMAAEDREGGAALDEHHIKRPEDARGMGSRDFVSTDNNVGIPSHFTPGGPFDAFVPRVDACIQALSNALRGGASMSLYHRVTRLAIIDQLPLYDQIVAAIAPLIASAGGRPPSDQPDASPGESPGATPDAIDAARVRIIGKHRMDPAKAAITQRLRSASMSGGKALLRFDELAGWPTQGDKKVCDGGVCILWPDGDGYVGGWFDHHGRGQTVKTMANINGGYVDGKQPPRGAPCWMYLIGYDGKRRTNIAPAGEWRG